MEKAVANFEKLKGALHDMKINEAYEIYVKHFPSFEPTLGEAIDRIIDDKNKRLENFDQLELSEVKARMALEDANQRIEQLEEILHEVNKFAAEYAPFNSAMAKIQKMAEERLHEEG